MALTLDGALALLEPLRHKDRVKHCIRWAKEAARGDENAIDLLEALRTSPSAYARGLALWSWHGSRDVELLVGALQDDSRTLRRRAAGLVHHLDDAGVLRALPLVAHDATLGAVLVRLARQRRHALIDTFVQKLSPQDPRSGAQVPFASASVVAAWSGPLESSHALRRLASRHPHLALRRLADPLMLHVLVLAGPKLARALPDPTLSLLKELLGKGVQLSALWATLVQLVRLRPEHALALLAEAKRVNLWHPGQASLDREVAEVLPLLAPAWSAWVTSEAAVALSSKVGHARWLRAMGLERLEAIRSAAGRVDPPLYPPPFPLLHLFSTDDPRRGQLFQRWLGEQKSLPYGLEGAPQDLRAQAVRERWPKERWERRAAAIYLPAEEVEKRLASWLRHRTAWERGEAAACVVNSLVAWPDRMERVAAFVRESLSKDDERLSILQALHALPLHLLSPQRVQSFESVLHSSLDDPGQYDHIRTQARALSLHWMAVHPIWAVRWFLRLGSEKSYFSHLTRPLRVDPEALPLIDAELAPTVTNLCEGARWSSLLELARSLSSLLPSLPSLQEGLREQIRRDNNDYTLGDAVQILRSADPKRTRVLLDELLDSDGTLGRVKGFAEHVSCVRQDLLPIALSQDDSEREEGRFLWMGLEFPDVARGYGSWTEANQAELGGQLAASWEHTQGREADRAMAVRMTRLGWCPSVLMSQLAHREEAQREMAVRLVGRLDSRSATLQALEQTMGDERARWAIYAMNRVMAELSGSDVVETLRKMPLVKVTVAKEVVRLLGDRGGDAGLGLLLEMLEGDLHRDVRIAAQRGLWAHLHREEAWTPFEQAAVHEDARVVGSLVRLQVPPHALPRLASLLAKALSHPDRRLQHDLLGRIASEPSLDSPVLRHALLVRSGDWHEELVWQAVASWASRAPLEEAACVEEACRTLLQMEGRALARVLEALIAQAQRAVPLLCAVGEALLQRGDPPSMIAALQALSGGGAHERILALLEERANRGTLHAALLQDADKALSTGPQRLLEDALSGSPHAALRWLAAGCLLRQKPSGKGQQVSWEKRRAALARDASPLVCRRAMNPLR